MLANTALHVEKVLACAANVKIEIAFVSTCLQSKELQGTQRKMDPYLKLICLFDLLNLFFILYFNALSGSPINTIIIIPSTKFSILSPLVLPM